MSARTRSGAPRAAPAPRRAPRNEPMAAAAAVAPGVQTRQATRRVELSRFAAANSPLQYGGSPTDATFSWIYMPIIARVLHKATQTINRIRNERVISLNWYRLHTPMNHVKLTAEQVEWWKANFRGPPSWNDLIRQGIEGLSKNKILISDKLGSHFGEHWDARDHLKNSEDDPHMYQDNVMELLLGWDGSRKLADMAVLFKAEIVAAAAQQPPQERGGGGASPLDEEGAVGPLPLRFGGAVNQADLSWAHMHFVARITERRRGVQYHGGRVPDEDKEWWIAQMGRDQYVQMLGQMEAHYNAWSPDTRSDFDNLVQEDQWVRRDMLRGDNPERAFAMLAYDDDVVEEVRLTDIATRNGPDLPADPSGVRRVRRERVQRVLSEKNELFRNLAADFLLLPRQGAPGGADGPRQAPRRGADGPRQGPRRDGGERAPPRQRQGARAPRGELLVGAGEGGQGDRVVMLPPQQQDIGLRKVFRTTDPGEPESLDRDQREYPPEERAANLDGARRDLYETVNDQITELFNNNMAMRLLSARILAIHNRALTLRLFWDHLNRMPQCADRIQVANPQGHGQAPIMAYVYRMGQTNAERLQLLNDPPQFNANGQNNQPTPEDVFYSIIQRAAHRSVNCMVYDTIRHHGRRLLLNTQPPANQHALAAKFIHNSQRAFWNTELLEWAAETNQNEEPARIKYALNTITRHALQFRV